jgi:hypothetical protein
MTADRRIDEFKNAVDQPFRFIKIPLAAPRESTI